MREEELRAVLLVKAVEEVDGAGVVIPTADRVTASREAVRQWPEEPQAGRAEAVLPERAQRLLATRAGSLRTRIAARHPVAETVLALARGPAWMRWIPVILGLALGVSLSALDGTRRINVLAFPLFGLIAWNFLMYLVLFLHAVRGRERGTPALLPGALARSASGYVTRLVARSRAFDALLAQALERFAQEWFTAAKPLLVARATKILHLAAAAVGAGLIAGLYFRGVALDYQAGWESTFLDANGVRTLLAAIYGPASWLTSIAIPDAAQLEALRWQAGGGGARADRWIHLLAATAALYVVLPRLALALAAWLSMLRHSRRMPLPGSLSAYFRAAFGGIEGSIERGTVLICPYAYEPSSEALERLRTWLPTVIGAPLPIDLRAAVAYGGEDEFVQSIAGRGGEVADIVVLLFSLATTPEDDSHGAFITGVRDWLAGKRRDARVRVVIDEAPYAARMGADRVEERRRAWREFVAARGLQADLVNLSA
jgi:uncharacterized protein DUF2868